MCVDAETAWDAVIRRDRAFDGQFVTGVMTTGIYCRPSCAARHPARVNVRFFEDGVAARAAGLRACKRCLPDDVTRDEAAVAQARTLLEGDDPPALVELARLVGYAPQHFARVFARAEGMTPARYLRSLRLARAQTAMRDGASVTDALYDAGYATSSRFYADSAAIGMTPSAWARGGKDVTIRWAVAQTTLGDMLLAATDRGICRLSFDEGETDLRAHFPHATLVPGDTVFQHWLDGAIAAVEDPQHMPILPLDIGGTSFQQAVWRALQRIPAGETRTYSDIAKAVGHPKAVRAAGTANGQNRVSVLIPCHRVIRTDGTLGGYAYGLERKAELLRRERA